METYTLTAELHGDIRTVTIEAPNDTQATMEAITVIMDTAYEDKKGPWAKGAIALVDSKGELIQSMEAKA